MKKIIPTLFVLIASTASAQSYEDIERWNQVNRQAAQQAYRTQAYMASSQHPGLDMWGAPRQYYAPPHHVHHYPVPQVSARVIIDIPLIIRR
jgi:hypothetical protein